MKTNYPEWIGKENPVFDTVEPIFLGNFKNNRNALCIDLMAEAVSELIKYGWEDEFTMYYYGDWRHVRLYLRIAYVGVCHLDGPWSEIKERLPKIIPLAKSLVELHKERDFGLKWIDREFTRLEWISADKYKIVCDYYSLYQKKPHGTDESAER
ncbi:hypothetical protein [Bacteroides acidifaciens]|uniref:hypothetical protein n=1 Tax=Bacteroides acidifaciens TaxID=85831 RepID=UPI002608B9E9|nr:hypothetical protein [Bacteroides acidifaciens]